MSAKIYAEYLDHMGSDLTVVNAARASFGKESDWELVAAPRGRLARKQLKPEDANLIRFLATGFRSNEWEDFLDKIITLGYEIAIKDETKRDELTTLLHEYKRKAQHWAPFAHPQVQIRMTLPIFLARQFVKHCVTGDTEISFQKTVKGGSNGINRRTIKDLYNMWSGVIKYQGGKKGKRNVSGGHIRVFNEDTQCFETSHIVDVIHQGTKPVFRVNTKSGQFLRATGNHKVMTQRGWVEMHSLSTQDFLITEMGVGDLLVKTEPRWNDQEDKKARRGVEKLICATCGTTDELEADHIVAVSAGGSHNAKNMQSLCKSCHLEKSSKEKCSPDSVRNQYSPRYTQIIAIQPDGVEDVYDVTVEGIHNFLANGLVVHNCVGGVWSEESRRYISGDPEVWYPDTWHTRPQDIKQGSGGPISKQSEATWNAENAVSTCIDSYKSSLSIGVAPEEARITLPLNMMTTVVWTGSLAFWARVCNQRVDSHAQLPAQELGKIIASIIEPLFPVSWKHLTT